MPLNNPSWLDVFKDILQSAGTWPRLAKTLLFAALALASLLLVFLSTSCARSSYAFAGHGDIYYRYEGTSSEADIPPSFGSHVFGNYTAHEASTRDAEE